MPANSRLASACLCLALCNLAGAGQAGAEGRGLEEVVVTAAKSSQAVRALSSSIGILSAEELRSMGHAHINEAMQRIPGAWISRGNGQEHLTAIRSPVLTGAGSCGAFLMAQDGIALRAAGFCNVNQLFEASSELAERIEVLRGPGSAIHGSNALHGVVNVINPAPEAGLARLRLEAGPYDYYRGRASLSSARLRLDLDAAADGGFKDDSGFGQQKLLLAHRRASDARSVTSRLACTNLNQETAGFVEGRNAYKDDDLRRRNPNPEAYRDASACRLAATIDSRWRLGELRLRPYARSQRMTFLQHFLPGAPVEENGQESLGFQAHLTGHDDGWIVGAELEGTRGYLTETQPRPIPLAADSANARLVATVPVGRHYDYEVDAYMAAAFSEYRRQLTPSLYLVAGLRFESMQYRYDNRMLDGRSQEDGAPCGMGGCRFSRPADRKDSFAETSPKLGLVLDLGASHQMYGQAAKGYRLPQATELYRLQTGQTISSIEPEELDAVELGLRGATGSASYDLSLFAMQKRNFIFRDTGRQNVDSGETRHRGLEVAADWQLAPSLAAGLAFTWARHEYANNPALAQAPVDGNRMDTAPETLGSATLAWTSPKGHRLEVEWVHVGSHYTDPANSRRYPGHDLLHLRGSLQASPGASLFWRVMNLANARYAERADYSSFGGDRYFVGQPLAVFIGIELRRGPP